MKIFLTGASGVLGRRLVRQLTAGGHFVIGLVRSEKAAKAVADCGGVPKHGNHFDVESLTSSAAGCDVVIHAATSIPTSIRYSPKDWELNDRLRREGTRALTECTARIGAKFYAQQSIVWVARPPDCSPFDENSTPRPASVYASALDSEEIANEVGNRNGFSVAILRCGLFYSADAAHTKIMADALKKRRAPIIGSGDAIWSVIHADDAANAFKLAVEAMRAGLWHIVDHSPVAVADFLSEFARLIHAPAPRHIPAWMAKWIVGTETVNYFTASTITNSSRFQKEFAWKPKYENYREGLKQVAQELAL